LEGSAGGAIVPPEASPSEGHGEEHGGHKKEMLLELPEFLPNVLSFLTFNPKYHGNEVVGWLHYYAYENLPFALLSALALVALVRLFPPVRSETEVPSRPQAIQETVVEGLDTLVCGVLGPYGRKYSAFIGSLFVYIWLMNMQGLVPGLKSPTSYLGITAGMGVTVFCYVQCVGIRENGVVGYLLHLAGGPRGLVGWLMAPLMLVLHVIGEFIKPLSLSLRLFGNIMGEDALIGVFALLGIVLLSAMTGGPTTLDSMMGLEAQTTAKLASWQWFGIPLQIPFMMLAVLTGTIQALVFSLLSTIYIFLMLPHEAHEEHAEGKGHAHAHQEGHA
jgi:F-type H+-transporting ATPase subunit a